MQLSIIIVNYNVRYFLEQCLRSVLNAAAGLTVEIIVVDNHSTDGSMEYLPPLFPPARFMVNDTNLGFAKANNRALPECSGEYVLFLNPDTLLPEDGLHCCLSFIREHPRAGALGVRMLDGRGCFLPESKRAFPSPLVSFYKLVGLAALFPRSRVFNRYALGHLDENQNHSVEVLAGAFMLVKRELLNQLNGFDESYFLYGEDIDLSYRIRQAGFDNLYFAGTPIIHFKGESSADRKLSRVKFFYQAMLVFVQKHYQTRSGKLFSSFLQLAIGCRALLSACNKLFRPVLLPLADGVLVWLSLKAAILSWVHTVRDGKDFGIPFIPYALPAFSCLFILSAAFTGLYDKRQQTSKTLMSVAFAGVSILAVYSLLPETLRFSRGVILFGGLMGGLLVFLLRKIFFITDEAKEEQTVIVADEKEYAGVKQLLENAIADQHILGRVSPGNTDQTALCILKDLPAFQKKTATGKIIFCIGTLSLQEIITQIQVLGKQNTRFLFHIAGSGSIVGSHQPAPGATIVTAFADYRITHPFQKRMKRVVDLFLSFVLLLTIPVHWILHPHTTGLIRNCYRVLTGKKTWVGYGSHAAGLPEIKKGVVYPISAAFDESIREKADKRYAKNYDWWEDMGIVFQNYRWLG